MKKLLPLLLFLAFATTSKATITYTLLTPPCDTNGVLVIQFTGFYLPPFHATWIYGTNNITHTMTGFTDTIRNYGGQTTFVYLYDSTFTTVIDTGSYYGTPPLTFTTSSAGAVCPALGTVNVAVTSGTGPFSYQWYQMTTGAVVATTSTATLPTGQYGIWITNGTGCSSGTPVTGMSDSIYTSTTFWDSLGATPANCTDGTASLAGIIGTYTAPLSYLWSNGSTATSITGLSAGSYWLTVSDSAGCASTGYVYVTQAISITAATAPTPATCLANDGAIIGFGGGGMPPYSYLWSNGATTQSQTGLYAGSYDLTVTDANGCIGTGYGYVAASTPITVTYVATPSSCTIANGTVSLVTSGGTSPYHDTFYTSPMQTGSIATGLAPGTYMFRVVDAVGCVQEGSVVVPPIDNMAIGFTQTPATCTLSNGSLTVYETGGVAPISYVWNTGATTPSITGQPTGWYTVTITDANSCTKTKYGFIDDYSPLSLGVSSVPATCIFTSNGSASVIPYSGTAPYTYNWYNTGTSFGTTATVSGLPTGPYWVYVTDHVGCTAWQYDFVDYNTLDSSCFCTIKGCIYHDANVNCTKDAGENGIPNVQVQCSGFGYTYTDDSGNYSFIVPTGTYTVSETIQAYYPLSGCQANNIPVTVLADSGCVHIVNFANVYDTLHDIQVTRWDYEYPVVGNAYTQISIIHNAGSVTEIVPVSGVHTDSQIFTATFTPAGVYGSSPTYDYRTLTGSGLATLAPGASQSFLIDYNVPTFIPIGTMLTFKDTATYIAPMDTWITDYTPWNNVNYWTTPVVAAYDPNFMEVNPRGIGTTGIITTTDSNMQYMVHFQNTGTANAQNIVIIDTLDANLNWTSLRPVFSTAPCKITQSANGKIVKYTFSNINLPPASSNPVTSNGMFTYSIKMRPGLTYGSQIHNSASIYFDYNAPIKTNTTLNTIGFPTVVNNTVTNTTEFFTVYPNPAGNSFNAMINSDAPTNNASLIVADITGKTLINKNLALTQGMQTVSVDVNHLSAGVYLVTVNEDGKMQTRKLVIMR